MAGLLLEVVFADCEGCGYDGGAEAGVIEIGAEPTGPNGIGEWSFGAR